jgi:predicted nucleic acid-binding Zn ribbon protein
LNGRAWLACADDDEKARKKKIKELLRKEEEREREVRVWTYVVAYILANSLSG